MKGASNATRKRSMVMSQMDFEWKHKLEIRMSKFKLENLPKKSSYIDVL